jgi:hypothetical protein
VFEIGIVECTILQKRRVSQPLVQRFVPRASGLARPGSSFPGDRRSSRAPSALSDVTPNRAARQSVACRSKPARNGRDRKSAVHCDLPCDGPVAALQELTGPSLAATSGVTIQGSPVNSDGSFSPQGPYSLIVPGETFTGYVPAASAALVTVTLR